ncbi:hypothetical protein BJX76DRAFT_369411 [Aspergillus varians]
MVAPVLVVRIGCFFGFLTCDTPRGEWPEGLPTVISPWPTGGNNPSTTLTGTSTAISSTDTTFSTGTTWTTVPASTFVSSSVSSDSPTGSSTSDSSDSPLTSTPVVTTTTRSTSSSMSVTASTSILPAATGTLAASILVIARDSTQASVASSGLNGYGIPFTTLLVPEAGVELPALNTSSGGNFGGIVVAGEVSYDYGSDSWRSALTDDQWNQLYAYQLAYGVRMVQYDVFPGPNFGASAVGSGCCADGVEQLVYFSDTSDFPTAGLRTGSTAGVSTAGLWHYPASISDTNSTKAIATFAAGGGVTGESTAAVINNFNGRQQMVFFIGFDTVWSQTSNYLQHAWITWITRGLYAGYRRVNLNTQIDDMFLQTDIYQPAGEIFRITPTDMDGITSWLPTIRDKLNPGSTYFVEIGHNGNGNIEAGVASVGENTCSGGAIEYESPPDTPLEFQKPLGTGTSLWPSSPSNYTWTTTCTNADSLLVWFQDHLNDYAYISHTFTHLEQNNATFSDINKEISFNQAWLEQTGFSAANRFTSNGIIPPAITGLHNGDALRAWSENGITNCVGDNTRPALLNTQNPMWPLFTTVATNGFDGVQINPRFATRIYYNCDTPACTTQEWIDTSAGAGNFDDLLAVERSETLRHFFSLARDPYMFHQANLRNVGIDPITVNGETGQFSIFQAWVETIVAEFTRLVTWPVVSTTHQQMSDYFLQRYRRDQCGYTLSYILSNNQITGVTVSANGNTCDAAIPVTFPDAPSNTQGFTTEQLGSDPVTVWAQLSGSPVTFTLTSPIAL